MDKLKLYTYTTWILLGVNILVLGFFLLLPKQMGRKAKFEPQAIQMLQLDKEQAASFSLYAKQHARSMDSLTMGQRELVREYFQVSDYAGSPDTGTNDLLSQIQNREAQKVRVTWGHFKDVYELLRPEQQPAFDHFEKEALNLLLLEMKGKGTRQEERAKQQ